MKSKGWACCPQGNSSTWAQKCIFLTYRCFKVLDFELSSRKECNFPGSTDVYKSQGFHLEKRCLPAGKCANKHFCKCAEV